MICCCIIHSRTATSRFDVDYYLNKHMPMTLGLLSPALKGATVETGVASTVEGQPPAHAATLQGDIANYTDVAPIIRFNEVKIAE